MAKRNIFTLLFFCCLIINLSVSYADSADNSASPRVLADANSNSGLSSLDKQLGQNNSQTSNTVTQADTQPSSSGLGIPDWLKRTDYAVEVGTDTAPSYYIETVQPLWQSDDKVNTVFTHDRISIEDSRGTYSPGVGYRRLLFDNNLMAGINTFFDYQDLHQEYRQGVGLEAITKTVEFRTNAYFDLSPARLISDDNNTPIFEKVVNGGDVEIGAPIPYVSWVKMFGSYYRYAYRYASDMSGWQERVQFSPVQFATINFITREDNTGPREYEMDGRITLRFQDFTIKSLLSMFTLAPTAYPDVDLTTRTLDRVERNFNIQTERYSPKGGGLTVEIGRT